MTVRGLRTVAVEVDRAPWELNTGVDDRNAIASDERGKELRSTAEAAAVVQRAASTQGMSLTMRSPRESRCRRGECLQLSALSIFFLPRYSSRLKMNTPRDFVSLENGYKNYRASQLLQHRG